MKLPKEKQKKSLLDLITAENLQEVNSDKKGLEELTKRFNEVTEFLFATDEVQKVLKEKEQKIADLEAKLEESNESHHKNIVELTKIATEKDRKIKELKQQLTEKDKLINNYADDLEKVANENADLVFKLAEKEAEIKNLVFAHFESETNKPILTTTQMINQDKISFAVEQLEQLRIKIKKIQEDWNTGVDYEFTDLLPDYEIYEEIDNQINVLRNNKDGIHKKRNF